MTKPIPTTSTSDSGTRDNEAEVGTAWTTSASQQIALFAALNMLAVLLFALLHGWSQAADLQTRLDYRSYVCWIALETFCLFLPSLAIGLVGQWWFGAWGRTLGFVSIILTTAIYSVDFAVFVTLREHLFSEVFFKLALSVLPFLHAYIGLKQLALTALAVFLWLACQWLLWLLAQRLSRTQPSETKLGKGKLATIVLLGSSPVIFALVPAFSQITTMLDEIHAATDRHPITACGWFAANSTPTLKAESWDTVRGRANILANWDAQNRLIDRYTNLRIQKVPTTSVGSTETDALEQRNTAKLPDIVIILSECLRPEIITTKTTPNLRRMADQGLWMKQHFTVGNASCFSFFGVMFGLDACWYEKAGDLPIGLFDGLKQAGYKTGFFGYDDFDTFDMETFCSPDRFDVCELVPPTQSTEADEKTCRIAADFFDRKGIYADDPDAPRVAIVYIYSPHDYFYTAEDEIHSPEESLKIGDAQRRNHETFARYLNSIYFMDRIISPLLAEDRMVFVMGDHGESFGEDQRSMHGSALSQVQCHVGCVAFGPGIPKKQIDRPTSHADILPTILDGLKLQVSDPKVFSGVSLLEEIPDDRIVACRGLQPPKFLFISPNRKVDDPIFGYQGFFHWPTYMLATGAEVDIYGDEFVQPNKSTESTDAWEAAGLMRQWMEIEFDAKFAEIPKDPSAYIRHAIRQPDINVRLHAIELIGSLGVKAKSFIVDVEERLSDEEPIVRDAAFKFLHDVHHLDESRN